MLLSSTPLFTGPSVLLSFLFSRQKVITGVRYVLDVIVCKNRYHIQGAPHKMLLKEMCDFSIIKMLPMAWNKNTKLSVSQIGHID